MTVILAKSLRGIIYVCEFQIERRHTKNQQFFSSVKRQIKGKFVKTALNYLVYAFKTQITDHLSAYWDLLVAGSDR